jgi:hypothetical protein
MVDSWRRLKHFKGKDLDVVLQFDEDWKIVLFWHIEMDFESC